MISDGLAVDGVGERGAADVEDQQHGQGGARVGEHERGDRCGDVIVADFERPAEQTAEAQRRVDTPQRDYGRRLADRQVDEHAERTDHHSRHEQSLQREARLRCTEVDALVRRRAAQMCNVREGIRKTGRKQEADRGSEPRGQRFGAEAVGEGHHHQHHRRRAHDRDGERGRAVQDRRHDELDDDHEAREEPHKRTQTVQPAGREQQDAESDREPEHCAAAVEVCEREPRSRSAACRGGVLVDANPVSLRDVERSDRRDGGELASLALSRAVEDLDLDDPAGVRRGQAARAGRHVFGDGSDRPDRPELPGAAELAVRPEDGQADDRGDCKERDRCNQDVDDVRATQGQRPPHGLDAANCGGRPPFRGPQEAA